MFLNIRWLLILTLIQAVLQPSFAQITLIDSLADGGFESGSSFSTNGWTAVNGQTNIWVVGGSGPLAGTKCAYVSKDGGVSPGYNIYEAAVSHFYRDITFPANGNFGLKFYYKGLGQANVDVLKIYIVPASVTPAADTLLTVGQIGVSYYWNSSQWKAVYINLGSIYNGTTQRLVFSWTNNDISGTQPAVSLDKISIASYTPLSGIKTIDKNYPTSGNNYRSFSDAINALNLKGVDIGGLTYHVTAGQTFSEQASPITTSGSAGSPVSFQRSGNGVNPKLLSTGVYNGFDAAIALWGGDYFTFDGIDISTNNGSTVKQGFFIRQVSDTNGANHNTIKNCKILMNNAFPNYFGIYQYMITAATSVDGTNSHNKYYNLTIENCHTGIDMTGISSAFPDDSCQIGLPGAQTVNIIGCTTNGYSLNGIQCSYQKNLNITGVEISKISGNPGYSGISVSNPSGNLKINHCSIHDITNTISVGLTSSNGIILSCNSNLYPTVDIVNNFIYNIFCPNVMGGSGSRFVRGIRIASSGTGLSTVNIFHNSVRIPGSSQNETSCIDVNASPTLLIKVLNNNFYNAFPGQGYDNQYCFASDNINTIGGPGSISDYNNFYFTGVSAFVGLGYMTTYKPLSAWQAAMNMDQHSFFADPAFVSATDLHVIPFNPTALESAGTTTAAVSDDIEGDIRPGPAGSISGGPLGPDIGADEFDGVPSSLYGPVISYTPVAGQFFDSLQLFPSLAAITGPHGVDTSPGNKPRIYYKNHSETNAYNGNINTVHGWKWTEATNNNSPFSFSIDYNLLYNIPQMGDTIDYFIAAQDTSVPARMSVSSGLLSSYHNGVDLSPDCFPVFSTVNAYLIKTTLKGEISIGNSGTFENLTGTDGLFDVLNKGGITGDLTARFISDVEEPGTTALNQFITLGGNWTLTIAPDTNEVRTISGTYAGGLIRLNGADRVIIDGSFNNAGRYLKFVNKSGTGTISTFQFSSLGSGLGASNNILKNCYISTGSMSSGSYGISIGAATAAAGMNNDSIEICNNRIFNAYTGIYLGGTSTGKARAMLIKDNIIGHSLTGKSLVSEGITITGADGARIENNEIFNIVNTSGTNNISGINLGAYVTNSTVLNNTIREIKNTNTKGAYGIYLSSNTGNSSNILSGNVISGIGSANNAQNSSLSAIGVMVGGGTNNKLYYNSICLSGQQVSSASGYLTAAVYFSVTAQTWDIRNNLFVNNMTTALPNAKNYACYLASGSFGTIDYNDYYVSGQPHILGYLNGDKVDLNAWKTATGQDQHSFSMDPDFNSPAVLAPLPGSPVLNTGTPISGITTDITGTLRSTANPTPGAYEEGMDRMPPQITYKPLLASYTKSNYLLNDYFSLSDTNGIDTSFAFRPRLYYKKRAGINTYVDNTPATEGWKYAEGSGNGPLFSFNIDYSKLPAANPGSSLAGTVDKNDTIEYFILACDASALHNLAVIPCYLNEEASSTLLSPVNFPVDNTASYRVFDTISPVITVGNSGDFLTLTGNNGLFQALKAVSLIRDLNVTIISDLAEPGTMALDPVQSVGGKWRIIIEPADGNEYTISGAYSGGLIRLMGADRLTIDGSWQGSGQHLTIKNTGSTGDRIAIQLSSLGQGAGASNNIIRNCIITGMDKNQPNSCGIRFCGSTPSASSLSNDSNLVENNIITKVYYGIYLIGDNQTSNKLITIRNNTLGSADDANSIGYAGITLRGIDRGIVEGNHIFNIKSTTSYPTGILLSRYVVNSIVRANKIHNIKYIGTTGYTGYGIEIRLYLSNCNDTIADNMIWDISGDGYSIFGSGAIAGLAINDYSGGISLYHNLICLGGTYGGYNSGCKSAALFINGSTTKLDIRNNIFVSSLVDSIYSTQKTYAIYSVNPTVNFITMDNNIYAVGAQQGMLSYQGGDRPDLASLQVAFGQNTHSMNIMPDFYTLISGEPYPDTALNCRLDGTADPVADIDTDINGKTRDMVHPDIGPVDFTPDPGWSAQASSNSPAVIGDTLFLFASPDNMNAYEWTGPGSYTSIQQNPFIPNPNASNSGTYSLTVKDSAFCKVRDSVHAFILDENSVLGSITYCNTASKIMQNVKVILLDNLNQAVDSVLTDTLGQFKFQGLANGIYNIHLAFPHPWGGANAVDALMVIRYFVGMITLEDLKLEAADVDNYPVVSAVDGLHIIRRFVGQINTFPKPDWVFSNAAFTISNNAAVLNIKCICRGDVDGSYKP